MNDENLNQINYEEERSPFEEVIRDYINRINAQNDIYPLILNLIAAKTIQEYELLNKFIEKDEVEIKEDLEKIFIPIDKIQEYFDLRNTMETSVAAISIYPRNSIVSFVCQFDAFLSELLRIVYYSKPEILNFSDKNIQFSDLVEFDSIDDAKEYIIEKEIESVLRESHLKHFEWMEKTFKMKLRKDLPSFIEFLEITERRNLYVHNNGKASRQYIENCKKHGISDLEEIKVGEELLVDIEYFNKCYNVLFEIGVKLSQVLWRKLIPDQIEEADVYLNVICYDLLVGNQNKLALNLLTFATDTLKKHCDEEMLCYFRINKALAYYQLDEKEKAKETILSYDWSATGNHLKLAVSVLKEDYKEASLIMKVIGNSVKPSKSDYSDWPLFRKFRETDIFKSTYKEIFDEEFMFIEKNPVELKDIVNKMIELNEE